MTNETTKQSTGFKLDSKLIKKTGILLIRLIILLVFVLIETNFVFSLYSTSKDYLRLKAEEIWPYSFDPVARFVANVNWETREVQFDASVSRAYKEKIEKYIWRIDDGTGLIGESSLTHIFENPGYYRVHLSILDLNGQSDYATCNIYFAPSEIEKIEQSKVNTYEGNPNDQVLKHKEETVNYIWIPKGKFINYAQLLNSYIDVSNPAILSSSFLGNECGFSTRPYNIADLSLNVTNRNTEMAKDIAKILANTTGLVIVAGIFLMSNVLVSKKLSKEFGLD